MSPSITIITPSFNQGVYLPQAIESVIKQDYPKLQYIVIDGASTDNTPAVLSHYKPHISYCISESDAGQSDAINKGLLHADGDILMWLNSDDILLPGTIHYIASRFQNNANLKLFHGSSILFGDKISNKLIGASIADLSSKYPGYIPFPQPSSFFHRSVIDETGLLDKNLHYAMDHDLLVRAFLLGDVQHTSMTLSKYRIHSTSKTNSYMSFAYEWVEVFSRFLNSFPEYSNWRDLLQSHGLHNGTTSKYRHIRTKPSASIDSIVAEHLVRIIHTAYQSGVDTEAVKRILFIKQYLPSYCKAYSLDRLLLKLRLLPYKLRRSARYP